MIVEHPLGTIKRSMSGYYFLLRTIKKLRGEVALLFFANNLVYFPFAKKWANFAHLLRRGSKYTNSHTV